MKKHNLRMEGYHQWPNHHFTCRRFEIETIFIKRLALVFHGEILEPGTILFTYIFFFNTASFTIKDGGEIADIKHPKKQLKENGALIIAFAK